MNKKRMVIIAASLVVIGIGVGIIAFNLPAQTWVTNSANIRGETASPDTTPPAPDQMFLVGGDIIATEYAADLDSWYRARDGAARGAKQEDDSTDSAATIDALPKTGRIVVLSGTRIPVRVLNAEDNPEVVVVEIGGGEKAGTLAFCRRSSLRRADGTMVQ